MGCDGTVKTPSLKHKGVTQLPGVKLALSRTLDTKLCRSTYQSNWKLMFLIICCSYEFGVVREAALAADSIRVWKTFWGGCASSRLDQGSKL